MARKTATSGKVTEQIDSLIRARVTTIGIESFEEDRITRIIRQIAQERNKALVIWTLSSGFVVRHPLPNAMQPYIPATPEDEQDPQVDPASALLGIPGRKELDWTWDMQANGGKGALRSAPRGDAAKPNAIYLIKDLHHFFDDPRTLRALRDLCRALVPSRKTLILLSPYLRGQGGSLPADLEKEITMLRFPLPSKQELRAVVQGAMKNELVPAKLTDTEIDELATAMGGLTETEAESTLRQAMIITGELASSAIPIILEEKEQIVAKQGKLEPVSRINAAHEIGGLDILRSFMEEQERNSSPEALEFFGHEADLPKGFLAVGHPGTGKSLIAKAAGGTKRSVWRLDISKIYASLVGASEQNLSAALDIAEAMGITLWVDEIEKLFGGNGGENNGGTSDRLLGILLTWYQEQTSCYVVATANSIAGLPGALLRRFDTIFFVDLPTKAEREEILAVHLRKRKRDPQGFELAQVASATAHYSGAELEKVVKVALSNAWSSKRELRTEDLLLGCSKITPMYDTQRAEIESLRDAMIKGNVQRASYPEAEQVALSSSGDILEEGQSSYSNMEL